MYIISSNSLIYGNLLNYGNSLNNDNSQNYMIQYLSQGQLEWKYMIYCIANKMWTYIVREIHSILTYYIMPTKFQTNSFIA